MKNEERQLINLKEAAKVILNVSGMALKPYRFMCYEKAVKAFPDFPKPVQEFCSGSSTFRMFNRAEIEKFAAAHKTVKSVEMPPPGRTIAGPDLVAYQVSNLINGALNRSADEIRRQLLSDIRLLLVPVYDGLGIEMPPLEHPNQVTGH